MHQIKLSIRVDGVETGFDHTFETKFFNVVDQHHYKIHSMVIVRRSRLYGTMCLLDIKEYEGWWLNKDIMAPPRTG